MRDYIIKIDEDEYRVSVEKIGNGVYKVKIGDKIAQVIVKREVGEKAAVKEHLKIEKEEVKRFERGTEVDSNVVKAMLPGTVLKIFVNVGERVKAGQALLILEAMKMENEIVSPKDGVVREVKVREGERVETGKPLIVIE